MMVEEEEQKHIGLLLLLVMNEGTAMAVAVVTLTQFGIIPPFATSLAWEDR